MYHCVPWHRPRTRGSIMLLPSCLAILELSTYCSIYSSIPFFLAQPWLLVNFSLSYPPLPLPPPPAPATPRHPPPLTCLVPPYRTDSRWRAERNFYISLMFLSCSILADRVRLMLKETEKLNEQIREMRRS